MDSLWPLASSCALYQSDHSRHSTREKARGQERKPTGRKARETKVNATENRQEEKGQQKQTLDVSEAVNQEFEE